MERIAKKYYPEMTLDFCTEVDCLARPFCPGLKKNNRLYEYEETGLTPEQIVARKWIPVEERLPDKEYVSKNRALYGEDPTCIVMALGARLPTILAFDGYSFYEPTTEELYGVTHWMELPAPPMKEEV